MICSAFILCRTLGARGFFLVGGDRTLSGEAAKESHEAASTTRSEAPRRWRARRPLASRVLMSRVDTVIRYIEVDFTFGLPDYVRYIE